mmetsp:Transcript_33439/g.75134  ORF Transcript_33439/g.75134 Transcript_33439/m.75134 type:complete len:246 (-) Transcript_33439:83-820(-)
MPSFFRLSSAARTESYPDGTPLCAAMSDAGVSDRVPRPSSASRTGRDTRDDGAGTDLPLPPLLPSPRRTAETEKSGGTAPPVASPKAPTASVQYGLSPALVEPVSPDGTPARPIPFATTSPPTMLSVCAVLRFGPSIPAGAAASAPPSTIFSAGRCGPATPASASAAGMSSYTSPPSWDLSPSPLPSSSPSGSIPEKTSDAASPRRPSRALSGALASSQPPSSPPAVEARGGDAPGLLPLLLLGS